MSVKHVLITGCSRGIGLGLVKSFHDKGFKVIATCRNPGQAPALQELIKELNLEPPIALDVSNDEGIQSVFTQVKEKYKSIEVLVNNAGISTSNHPDDPPGQLDRKEMDKVLSVNVSSVGMLTQSFLPIIRGSDGSPGKVIYISSLLGSIQLNTPKETNFYMSTSYRCSKAALNQLVKCFSLVQDQENMVHHLAVHPGHVQTDMGGSRGRKAPLQVEDVTPKIASLVDYLNQETNGQFVDYESKILPY
ncbi:C-signal-like [Tigriopus californicus]|uniref:C-signal-like n=1 Tax=Tigriopus californicus TaxID=6832 RepID=UPI0027DA0C90|nr:C-signal-like [Tigriopus californicus]